MKQFRKLQTAVSTGLVTLALLPVSIAHADFSLPQPAGSNDFTSGADTNSAISSLATTVLNIVLLVVGILAVFYLIYSGFQYITSAGDPGKVKTARQGIINAIIGIIIILAAFFIIRFAVGLGSTVAGTA